MKAAIRTDASSRIGSGHVMRCKTLADELRGHGAEVRFICRRQPGHLIDLLSDASHAVAVLPPADDIAQSADAGETITALDGFAPDWLIVDHYGLGEEWESDLRPHAARIFAIDDLANRRHDCDLLLDQNWFGDETEQRYRNLVPDQCDHLLGPQYALLQPLFSQLRRSLPLRDGLIRRALLFFGGVDSCHLTVKVLQALNVPEFADVAMDVVVGHANTDGAEIQRLVDARPGAALHRGVPSLAGLMAKAHVMLGAGGATTWERCCLGLPSIVAVTSGNQQRATEALATCGVHHSLGDAAALDVDDWANAVRALRNAPDRVKAYSAAALQVTDGRGASRVADVLTGAPAEDHAGA